MEQVQTQRQRRIAKPMGLYILGGIDFVVLGLIPLLTILLSIRNTKLELALLDVMISIGFPLFIMAATVWAVVGDNPARYVLLALLTLWSMAVITNTIVLFSSDEVGWFRPSAVIGFTVRTVFWTAINWWYFNRAHVVAYFKQNQ